MHSFYKKIEISTGENNLKNSIIDFYLKLNKPIKELCFFNDRCYFLSNSVLFETSFAMSQGADQPFILNEILKNVNAVCASLDGLFIQSLNGDVFIFDSNTIVKKRSSFKTLKHIYYSKKESSFILFNDLKFIFSSNDPNNLKYFDSTQGDTYWRPIDSSSKMVWYGYSQNGNLFHIYNKKTIFSYNLDSAIIGIFTTVINNKSFLLIVKEKDDNGIAKCSIIDFEILMTCENPLVFMPQGSTLNPNNVNVLNSTELGAVINSIKLVKMSDDYIIKVG